MPVGVLKLLVIALNLLESCLLYTAILYIKLLGLYNNFAKTWIRNYYSRKLAISVFIIFEFCLYHKLFFERPLCKLIVYTNVTVFCIWITHFFTYFFFRLFVGVISFPIFYFVKEWLLKQKKVINEERRRVIKEIRMKQQEEYDEMLRREREKSSSWSGIQMSNLI